MKTLLYIATSLVAIVCLPSQGQAQVKSGDLIINEIMAANIDVYRDPSTNFGSWVELYNISESTINLGGLYVSDDPNNLKKHQLVSDYGKVASKNFAVLNFDHHEVWKKNSYRQIDDKLDCEGGTIIISDGTNIIAQTNYPKALPRMSYARLTDGGDTWGWTGVPSPKRSNEIAGGFADKQLEAPVANRPSGTFTEPFTITIPIPEGATLKYTTSGATPTKTTVLTSENGIIDITSTKVLRFRFFKDGMLPSPVSTYSYIKSTNEPFPIVSVAINPNDFESSTSYGIFSQGTNGRPGSGQTTDCNWNMDWDRPVHFTYIKDGECVVSQECDFSACGGWSRAWTPHSFKLKATKVYDFKNTFDYPFFDEKQYIRSKVLQLRNGGNDNGCRIKDAAVQQIVARSGMNVNYQAWQPVHVYINSASYAVLNMREPNNKHYAYSNYGFDDDEIEQFEITADSGYVQMVGTGEYFRELCDLATRATDASVYEQIKERLDIDEFINYMAVELYTGCTDWPQNNVKGFRSPEDKRFHFVLFDMDFALNTSVPFQEFKNKQYYNFNTLYGYDYSQGKSISGTHRYIENPFVTMFLNLLTNETFRKQFIDTYCIVGGSIYTPSRVQAIVDDVANYLQQGGYVNPTNSANELKRGFSDSRKSQMISHLQQYFNLSSSKQQKVTLSSSIEGARLMVNNLEVPTGVFEGTLYAPVTYKAIAPAGYKFKGWLSSEGKQTYVFERKNTWKYADTDISSSKWKTDINAFSKSGKSPIGYGNNTFGTKVTGNKTAYYFARNFTLDKTPSSTDRFILNYSVDDGMVVYINGKEAGRYHMPSGTINYNTVASSYASAVPDEGTMEIEASLLKKGTNYIAIEVHNNSTTSSDIYWDADLVKISNEDIDNADYLSNESELTINEGFSHSLIAYFSPIEDYELANKGITPIKINEVSASNSIYINEHYKKDDWIELYNTTEEDIDIAGMYLTDDITDLRKYQIPHGVINTIIHPHSHFIIWASKRDAINQLHAPFKLKNAEGSQVILISEDGSWYDSFTYSEHTGTQSIGLYPDGSTDVYIMNKPTIAKTNIIDSNSNLTHTYNPADYNHIKDDFATDVLASTSSTIESITCYDLRGIMITDDINTLTVGTYIIKYKYTDGHEIVKKVFIKN